MATNVYTTGRNALINGVTAQFPSYQVIAGYPTQSGVPDADPLVFVWFDNAKLNTQIQTQEFLTYYVRFYPVFYDQQDPISPVDPTTIEQIISDTQTGLASGQVPTDTGDVWFFKFMSAKPDWKSQSVDIEFQALASNPYIF